MEMLWRRSPASGDRWLLVVALRLVGDRRRSRSPGASKGVLLAEGQELAHEPPRCGALSLMLVGLCRPELGDLLGFPDGCVRVRRLTQGREASRRDFAALIRMTDARFGWAGPGCSPTPPQAERYEPGSSGGVAGIPLEPLGQTCFLPSGLYGQQHDQHPERQKP